MIQVVDGLSRSSRCVCSRHTSFHVAPLRLRCGALAAMWRQHGAVVGRPLAGGWVPAGKGGGHRVGLQLSH
ncbi:hypothetical protein CesoFtcFv8_001364 [Champsocephalus esox]|uniref:Uncharacterized protein n=1 Tax=Champsocephalus esox TaxID=159716 RepID=A0AAN8HKP3_9TELE|nr:hypothetical protein CesoFtcFv8_001364 [Champsocephalus esox]